MKTLLMAALTLAVAIMAARAFSEAPSATILGGKSIAQGADVVPRLQIRGEFVDDGY